MKTILCGIAIALPIVFLVACSDDVLNSVIPQDARTVFCKKISARITEIEDEITALHQGGKQITSAHPEEYAKAKLLGRRHEVLIETAKNSKCII